MKLKMFNKKQQEKEIKTNVIDMYWRCEFANGNKTFRPNLAQASKDYKEHLQQLSNKYPELLPPLPIAQWDLKTKLDAMYWARPEATKEMITPPTLVKKIEKYEI